MERVPLWTFLAPISQILSRFNFEKTCFLDNLILRLATEYPAIVIYPFQVSYECFKERNPNIKFERPLIRKIVAAIANPFLQQFIAGLKVANLPEKVLQNYLLEFSKSDVNSVMEQQTLKAGYDDVFNNPMRGKLPFNVQAVKSEIDELLQMFGMFRCFIFSIRYNSSHSKTFQCSFVIFRAPRCRSNLCYGQETILEIGCIGQIQKTRKIRKDKSHVVQFSLVWFHGQSH